VARGLRERRLVGVVASGLGAVVALVIGAVLTAPLATTSRKTRSLNRTFGREDPPRAAQMLR